ncbi:hypothetical protein KR222_008004 [Zaprionus bogoriensis]|nr:hypothetical protein KR222_008004 [Zaprionus bogoriensis]
MFFEDDGVLFNPFNIGPPENNGLQHDFKIPETPTYPPPVFATWPAPKEHTNKSVSQGTILAKEHAERNAASLRNAKSKIGEMAFSKAINEEMAAAKRLAEDEDERINAGRNSVSSQPIQTLLPVRHHRSASKSSFPSQASSRMIAETSDRLSRVSKVSNKDTNARPIIKNSQTARDTDVIDMDLRSRGAASKGTRYGDNISQVSQRSRASARASQASTRDRAGEYQADQASRVSVRSHATDISRASRGGNVSHVSKRSYHEDNLSMKSRNERNPLDNVSVRSKYEPSRQPDNVSVRSTRSTRSQQPDTMSVRSKSERNQLDNVSARLTTSASRQGMKKPELSLKEVAEKIKKELGASMTTTKSLYEKAALLSDRLKAGNEFNHNRFSSLIRQYTNNEPLKRCREDRMSFWCKDALLS